MGVQARAISERYTAKHCKIELQTNSGPDDTARQKAAFSSTAYYQVPVSYPGQMHVPCCQVQDSMYVYTESGALERIWLHFFYPRGCLKALMYNGHG
jgi:hypothetical protein